MHLNQGLFRMNGACGYVLKPEVMRNLIPSGGGRSEVKHGSNVNYLVAGAMPYSPDMEAPHPDIPTVELEIEVRGRRRDLSSLLLAFYLCLSLLPSLPIFLSPLPPSLPPPSLPPSPPPSLLPPFHPHPSLTALVWPAFGKEECEPGVCGHPNIWHRCRLL